MNGEGAQAALSLWLNNRKTHTLMNDNTNDERFIPSVTPFHNLGMAIPWTSPFDSPPKSIQPEGSVGDINSDAKGSGARFNNGKADLSLIPFRILAESYNFDNGDRELHVPQVLQCLGLFQETHEEKHLYEALLWLGSKKDTWDSCARVFAYGKRKYAAWNWAKGMAWSIPLACAGRHCTFGILAGELVDPESNELHVGHIACNIVMLLTYIRTFPEGNDLPKVLA